MIKNYSFVLLCTALLLFVQNVRSCNRFPDVREAEFYCWSTQVEPSVKVDQAMSKLEEFVKAQLGMAVNNDRIIQDCKYYYCVFQRLNLLNSVYDVPCIDKLKTWIKSNVGMTQATTMLNRVQVCTGELANAMISGRYFLADNVDRDANYAINPTQPQSNCEISKEYMKCISVATAGDECPVLRYP